MNWLSRLEKHFGHLAIHGLLRYVAALSSICFVLLKMYPDYIYFLVLDRDLLLQGQVWRLFTYIFIPSIGGWFYPDWFSMAFYVMFLFWIGDGLERAWGEFRFNVFFFLGMLGTTIAALITNHTPGSGYLHMTIFLAFARFYPEEWIRLFFILPVKVKWLAWLDAAFLLLSFVGGSVADRAAIIAGMTNYLIFFGRDMVDEIRLHQEISHRRAAFHREVREGREDTLHRCTVCGLTEVQSPHAEFRVSEDGEEYCLAHLPKRGETASKTS